MPTNRKTIRKDNQQTNTPTTPETHAQQHATTSAKELTQVNQPTEQVLPPVIEMSDEVKAPFYHLTSGQINGLDAEYGFWQIRLKLNNAECFIVSKAEFLKLHNNK